MKVLLIGDAVVDTGFARCTHAAADALKAAGHEVTVIGINYYGDPHRHGYDIYPAFNPTDKGEDGFGVGRLPVIATRIKPDVVILLNDPWNVDAYLSALRFHQLDIPVIGWLAVDGINQHATVLNDLAGVMVWTQFAANELAKGGYVRGSSIVPLGVDTSVFKPRDLAEARAIVCPPQIGPDAFIVGSVGRNQPRKRLDLTLQYFAAWANNTQQTNAYLYIQVAPTGESCVNIRSLINHYGLRKRVILAEPENIGKGETDEYMSYLYSSFNVYLSTSQGEGWGLPALEAMACGVPTIVPDWAGLGKDGWPQGAAHLVPCLTTAMSAPMNSKMHTIGGIPDRKAVEWALTLIQTDLREAVRLSNRGIARAQELSWDATKTAFMTAFEAIMMRHENDKAAAATEPVEPVAAAEADAGG